MDKRTPLVALLCLAALPASAEFCTLNGHSGQVVVRRLKSPTCTMENALVFTKLTNENNRYGEDEVKQTHLTDSWPGWGGGDQKCAKARKAADSISYADETYVMGRTMLGWQIWMWNGSCDSLRSRFLSKQESMKQGGSNPSLEEVFEKIGGVDVGMSALVDRLIEGKKPKKD